MNDTEPSTSSEISRSKQPSNSAFKQQRLAAWQPILTAGTVLPTFFVIGILFIPVGIGLFYISNNVRETTINYTDCISVHNSSKNCADEVSNWNERDGKKDVEPCVCEMNFTLETDYSGDVYMYYALTNFYQNHRRYVKSRDDNQLYGGTDKPSKDCAPFDIDKDSGKWIWPCGAIANSMFQDEIKLFYGPDKKGIQLKRTGIAWESDKQFKFKNPYGWNATTFKEVYSQKFIKPKAWLKGPFELDPSNPDNNGLENEDFIIWMRTAALPNFRKLYRKVSQEEAGFRGGMPRGNYTLEITYSYPVKSFQGTKSIIFSTTSLLGGKNPFLGISYIIVGAVCLILGIVFLFVHINYGKSTWEMTNIDARTPF